MGIQKRSATARPNVRSDQFASRWEIMTRRKAFVRGRQTRAEEFRSPNASSACSRLKAEAQADGDHRGARIVSGPV